MFKGALYIVLLSWSLLGIDAVDICEDQLDGARLAHPADCLRFIQCHGGETVAIRYCPFGLHFNRYESICDYKYRAGCDISYALQLTGYDSSKKLDCDACRSQCRGVAGSHKDDNLSMGVIQAHSDRETKMQIASITKSRPPKQSTVCAGQPTIAPITTPCATKPSIPPPTRTTCSTQASTIKPPTTTSCGTKPSQRPTTPTTAPCITKPSMPPTTTIQPPTIKPPTTTSCATKPTRPPPPPQTPTTSATPSCPTKPPSGGEGGNEIPQPPSVVTGPSGTTCVDGGKCTGQKDGVLLPDDSSNGFIVCQCQCEIKMPCPAGLVFNPKLRVCAWDNV